jgi:CRISPR-associated protein Csd1
VILTALAEYYDVLAAKGELAREGWAPRSISYALSLSPDGGLFQVTQTLQEVQNGKKTAWRPQEMVLPEPIKRTVNPEPNFLCDNAAYLLGIDSKGNPERALRCFEAAKELHLRLLGDVETLCAKAITAFFSSWKPEDAEAHPQLQDCLEDIKKGGNIVFRIAGAYAQDDPLIRSVWQSAY